MLAATVACSTHDAGEPLLLRSQRRAGPAGPAPMTITSTRPPSGDRGGVRGDRDRSRGAPWLMAFLMSGRPGEIAGEEEAWASRLSRSSSVAGRSTIGSPSSTRRLPFGQTCSQSTTPQHSSGRATTATYRIDREDIERARVDARVAAEARATC